MSEKSLAKEIELRGATLRIAVGFESVLMSIVYSSSGDIYYSQRYAHLLKLKGCMFFQKIQRVKDALKLFHPDLLESNEKLFNDLDTFREFRNLMAHCALIWGDSVSEFEVWDIVEDENNFQYYAPTIKYATQDVFKILDKALKEIHPPLVKLWRDVELRLQTSNPKVFTLLQSQRKPPATGQP